MLGPALPCTSKLCHAESCPSLPAFQAYGQTGSGKTHTMSGTDVEQYSGRGINYRALDDLFDIREARRDEVCGLGAGAVPAEGAI